MAIENTVSIDFLSTFLDSIGVFNCRLPSVIIDTFPCSFQPKYEAALEHSDTVKVVTPDWVTDCIEKGKVQDEKIYHPRLIVYPKPESPQKPETPPKPEPMEVLL